MDVAVDGVLATGVAAMDVAGIDVAAAGKGEGWACRGCYRVDAISLPFSLRILHQHDSSLFVTLRLDRK